MKNIKTNQLNKIIACLCGLFLAMALIVVSYLVTNINAAETQESLNKKIENAQDELNKKNKENANIKKEMTDLEKKIDTTQKELDTLSANVAKAHTKLLNKKDELAKGNASLNSRLRNIYMGGNLGFLDVIFTSGNISDLFSNLEMVKYIFKNDKAVVGKLKNDYDEISSLSAALKQQESAMATKQKDLEGDFDELSASKKDVEKKAKELKNQISQWQADSQAIADMINNAQNGGGAYKPPSGESAQGFSWPVNGTVTREFGAFDPQWDVVPHLGMDIAAPSGTPIHASKAGKVIYAGYQGSYGNLVVIDHGNGISTAYAHNSGFAVHSGQIVKKGQVISYCGSTGNSSGPHCHFEVRINGHQVNPRNYL